VQARDPVPEIRKFSATSSVTCWPRWWLQIDGQKGASLPCLTKQPFADTFVERHRGLEGLKWCHPQSKQEYRHKPRPSEGKQKPVNANP